MPVSSNVHIMTHDELLLVEAEAFKRGVVQGKIENTSPIERTLIEEIVALKKSMVHVRKALMGEFNDLPEEVRSKVAPQYGALQNKINAAHEVLNIQSSMMSIVPLGMLET